MCRAGKRKLERAASGSSDPYGSGEEGEDSDPADQEGGDVEDVPRHRPENGARRSIQVSAIPSVCDSSSD